MGTDIHGYWELKTKDDVWVAFREVNGGRFYRWFGVLAGIRTTAVHEETKQWAARGMPPNSSAAWTTYTLVDSKDDFSWLHSHTWLSHDEARLATELYLREDERFAGERMKAPEVLPYPDEEMEQLYIVGARGKPAILPWFGKLSELVPPDLIPERTRMVVAFDS